MTAIILLVAGAVTIIWPKTVWKLTESWKYWGEDRTPSASSLRNLEILGAVFVGAGLYLLLFA